MEKLRIISRNSQLAMWQATYVKQQLLKHYPKLEISISGITTTGDRILDKSLDKIGGKGLFIKELEYQLLAGNADIAVHSLKDLPANLEPQFAIAAVLARESPYDAYVSNNYQTLNDLPKAAVVGTSSARRSAILKKYYPHLQIKLLRGNLQTRLNKLDSGQYDAIILAEAGLRRLGLNTRIKQILSPECFLPAIGQGALAIEVCRERNDCIAMLEVLNDLETYWCVSAERQLGKVMNASCNIPIAGFAQINKDELTLTGLIADLDQARVVTATAYGNKEEYLEIGQNCARQLIELGADQIINQYR